MKKILIISTLPPPFHGVTIYNEMLLNSKISNFFSIHHLDISDKRSLDNLGKIDITNVFLSFKNFFSLIKLLFKTKPDLVYLSISQNIAFLRDGIFIIISKFFSKSKVIVHLHGSNFKDYYNRSNFILKKFVDYTLARVDSAIVYSYLLKHIFDKWINNIEVVPIGTTFKPDISNRNNREITIGYLGNLIQSKGIEDFVKAANIILKKHRNIKFKIGGSWLKQEEKIKNGLLHFIKENKIINNIEFLGFIPNDDKEKFFLTTDIFVFPSWNEGQPLVILEAMAAGCPVISIKDVGAIPDTIIDGETGILVEKQNPEEIAKAIIYLIENPDIREKMGSMARKRFEENYTIDKNIDNMIKVFNKILTNNSY
ncbi:MAG: glycosyltransferase family 4 protein [Actinobacteria bacterium]|nr:glycosyltransferase family 4 protein [Chloroflexota bacterium]MBE3128912.1 glycosyltransferase family 4 protein [Actinomycetota bacterium]